MWTYAIKRAGAAAVSLVAASVIIFAFIHLIPGDPIYIRLGDMATPDQVESVRHSLGPDQPIFVQYLPWVGGVFRGDLGHSIFYDAPILGVIADHAETSLLLASITMVWVLLIGVPIGMIAAVRHGSWLDQGLSGSGHADGVRAHILGRALFDPDLCGVARVAAQLGLSI